MAQRSCLVVGLGNPGLKYGLTRHNVGFRVVSSLPSLLNVGNRVGLGTAVSTGIDWVDPGLQAQTAKFELEFAGYGDLDLCDRMSERRRLRTIDRGVAYPSVTLHTLMPMQYMNNSGFAVQKYLRTLGEQGSQQVKDQELSIRRDLLVVYDDIHTPFGELRLKPRGGDGGHNGLAHIIDQLGTSDFPRLRVGVGLPSGSISSSTSWSFFAPDNSLCSHVLEPFTAEQEQQIEHVLCYASHLIRIFSHRSSDHAATICNNRDIQWFQNMSK